MTSGYAQAVRARAHWPRRESIWAAAALAAFGLSVAVFAVLVAVDGRRVVTWFDFDIYYRAGLIVRHDPRALYSWHVGGKGFTYTPFAALLCAPLSLLPLTFARFLMATLSIAALVAALFSTAGAVGLNGRRRWRFALALAAGVLWTEPVLKSLRLGQVELLLMALVVWDLCRPDGQRLHGAGIGVAAGIKLVPLIFIVHLALCGRARAACRASVTFAATIAAGFLLMPQASVAAWLHGQLFEPAGQASTGSLVNQSLLGLLSRVAGGVQAARAAWLVCAAVTLLIGLAVSARLHRREDPVAGWLICAITGLLVSPISWDHHWVWIAPLIAYGALASMRRGGRERWLLATGTMLVTLLFLAWPRDLSGPQALLPGAGVLLTLKHSRLAALPSPSLVSRDVYVIFGIGLIAVAIAALVARRIPQVQTDHTVVGRPPSGVCR